MQNKKTTKKKKPKKTQANKQKLKNNNKNKVNCFTNGKRTYFQTLLKTKKYWSKRAQ